MEGPISLPPSISIIKISFAIAGTPPLLMVYTTFKEWTEDYTVIVGKKSTRTVPVPLSPSMVEVFVW
jgi:hypothetical protein